MDVEETNIIDHLKFSNFCELCEKISQNKTKTVKCEILRRFLSSIRQKSSNGNLFPIMRLFLPYLDLERGAYGIKEHLLAKIYIKILSLPKESSSALKLLNFREQSTNKTKDSVGDFAEVAYWILLDRCGKHTQLTIGDINKALDNIAKKHAEHSPDDVKDIFTEMALKMSAEEQKWFMRIILKGLHLGIGATAILNIFHPDSNEVLDFSNSLLKVCCMLRDINHRYHEMEIILFQPFRPMLSQKCDINKIKFDGNFYQETKMDGERFQIHYSNGEFKYFTRNGFDKTDNFGSSALTGFYSSLIQPKINSNCKSFILDGEIMSWDKKKQTFVTKGDAGDVKSLKPGSYQQPCFVAFDVVFFNGKAITNKSLVERLAILDTIFTSEDGVLMKLRRKSVTNSEEVLNALNQAIDDCEEGIIVKSITSIYKPNGRKGAGWFKLKPEYTPGALTELDVLIIGGFYGDGKHKGMITTFLLGLACSVDKDGNPNKFESLTRVGSGYSFQELHELRSKLDKHWVKFKKDRVPSTHILGKINPDVIISPENSQILQVKASEIIKSDVFPSGYTLRFVRVEKIRYDKSWRDCLTLKEFIKIRKDNQGMLTKGHITLGGSALKRKKPLEILPAYDKKQISKIPKKTNIFLGKELCVVSGTKEYQIKQLQEMILENGGKIVINPGSKTYCLIAGDINIRVKNFIKANKHMVTSYQWVLDCISQETLLDWPIENILAVTNRRKIEMHNLYDKYGDSFTEDATITSLMRILSEIDTEDLDEISLKEIEELDELLFEESTPYSFFRNITAFFKTANSQTKIIFSFFGGIIHEDITESTTYIIVDYFDSATSECNEDKVFVSYKWILDSYNAKKIIPFEDYQIEFN